MNPFAWSGLLAGVFSAILAFLVWFKCTNKRLGRTWLFFALSVAGWGFGSMGVAITKDLERALVVWRIADIFGIITIPLFLCHFVCVFCDLKKPLLIFVHYVLAAIFILFSHSSLFIRSLRWAFNSIYYTEPGPVYVYASIWWFFSVLYSHSILIRHYKVSPPEKKNQIKYFLFATVVGFSGGSFCFLPAFNVNLYPWGNFTIFLYTGIMSYAILKHHLLDLNIIIRKTLIYSLITFVMAAIMMFVAIVSAHFTESFIGKQTTALALTACLITIIFHPLQIKIQTFVDRYLFRDWADKPVAREIASGFSHELKSPLAGLSMQAQLMMAELEDLKRENPSMEKKLAKFDEGVRYILNQAMDAARRIEAVRGVAEPTRGQLEAVAVPDLIDQSLSALRSMVSSINVPIKRELPASLPSIYGDAKQLEIVFINLMKNALQAMDGMNGEADHSLSILAREMDGLVFITIKDTGPGIAAKDINRIFEPYFTTKGHKGTGMGLYLAQQIVKAHGGTIDVKSEEGKGTEFIVRLPKSSTDGRAGIQAA